jgi:thiamine-monophosphate kinase
VPPAAARDAFARPRPRTAEARWLAEHADVSALIDLSDGLAGDAGHIAAASDARIVLDTSLIPLHPVVRDVATSPDEALRLALSGGEDYELCFTARAGTTAAVGEEFTRLFGVPLTRVGMVEPGAGVLLRALDGSSTPAGGYDHLRGDQP